VWGRSGSLEGEREGEREREREREREGGEGGGRESFIGTRDTRGTKKGGCINESQTE
jgi:hypothetical protein